MSQPVYYPAISEIVTVNDIPEILSFVRDGIVHLFDKMYYKNLQFSKSIKGDAAFYSLDIVSLQKLGIEIPGTNISFVLNPDHQDNNISSFPLTVEWEWKVLTYKNSFNLSTVSFSVKDYFNLLLEIFNITEKEVLSLILKNILNDNSTLSGISKLISDVNTQYGVAISLPINT